VSTPDRMPTPRGSGAGGAPRTGGPQDDAKDRGPQDPSVEAAHSDGTLVLETVPNLDTTTTVGATTSAMVGQAAARCPTATTCMVAGASSSPPRMLAATVSAGTDNNAIEEPEVIMRHLGVREPRDASLSVVMGTTHFSLNQAHDVLHREKEDIDDEWLCRSVWVSLLKKQMTYEKEKAEVRHKQLDVMEILLNK
jgi:hypothetical protein